MNSLFRKVISLLMCFVCGLCIFAGCASAPAETTAPTESAPPAHMLDGKKFIIIGNSHTYVGKTVIDVVKTVRDQESRQNNKGLFYYICQAAGAEVSVTNWCFSGHGLRHLFAAPCTISYCDGERHEDYLIDRSFDYVVITPGVGTEAEEKIAQDMDYIVKLFRDANPDVKFVLLGNASVYGQNKTDTTYPGITGYYKTLEDQGFIIADWGGLVNDIINGTCTVPGSTETYNKNSFIINDGYHPNTLSGFITSTMLYCAITGEPAVEQTRTLFTENKLWKMILEQTLPSQYTYPDSETNHQKILASETELKGIQELIDRYLQEKPYRK